MQRNAVQRSPVKYNVVQRLAPHAGPNERSGPALPTGFEALEGQQRYCHFISLLSRGNYKFQE
jgi:hypothetical protein